MFISASTFFSLACATIDDVAVLVAEVHLAVGHEGRAPHGGEHVMRPVQLTGLGVEAVEVAAEVGDVHQAVGDGGCRNRSADLVEVPEPARLCDVAAFGGVDRVEVTDALAVLGVLSVGDIDDVLDDHGRRDQLVPRSRPHGVLRVGVELPQFLAGLGFVASHPAVALRRDDLQDAADLSDRWCGPLPVQDPVLDRVVFPDQLAGLLVERDDGRRARRRNVHVALVLAVRGAHVQHVSPDDRRRVREVVRIRADLFHHVERPDHVGVELTGQLLVGERAVVLVVAEALDVEADRRRRGC